jgi:hypothetical protein
VVIGGGQGRCDHAGRPRHGGCWLRRLAAVLAGLAIAAGSTSPAAGGAWTKEKGDGLAIMTGSFSYGDQAFDENGKLVPVPEYRKFEMSNHFEYGVTPWLTGILRAELRSAVENAVLDESTATGSAGARVRWIKAPKWVFSTELTALSGDFDTIGINEDPDDPGVDARALFGYGTAIRGVPVYGDVQVGYRYLSGSSTDEVRLDLALGIKPWERWEFIAQAFNTVSMEDGGGGDDFDADDGYRYHKLQLSALRRIGERTSVQVGAFGVVAGENALQEYGGLMALWYEF